MASSSGVGDDGRTSSVVDRLEAEASLAAEDHSRPHISVGDQPRNASSLETSGGLDFPVDQSGGRCEENGSGEDEDWPDGVEVECELEEVSSVVKESLTRSTNRNRGSLSVTVTNMRPRRSPLRAGIAGPSRKIEEENGRLELGIDNEIVDVQSSLLEVIPHLTRPYGCELCDYRGKYRSDLEAHMRTHTGEKPFACKLCDYRGTHSSHLKYHMRTHTGEKPFVCSICDYRCIHAGRLKDHMMSHTGEKPYSCKLCDFKCSRTGILKRHLRMHTGEKPYACDICDYKCSETGTLKTHKRIHTGEKPYACDLCEYRSVQASALRKHKKTHSSQNPKLTGHILVTSSKFTSNETAK